MSTDVLKYNSINASYSTARTTLSNTIDLYNNAVLATNLACATSNPAATTKWPCIPKLPSVTGTVLVCATDATYWRCGATCTWTVPAGATMVQFELWGPGAGSGSGCCCAIVPFGQTGAFASIIIPAVPGCQYTVCAGCAYCCYVSRTTHNTYGGASYVTGYGLCNLCAQGGSANICYRTMEQIYRNCGPAGQHQLSSDKYISSYGCCFGQPICNSGSDTCQVGSYASCGVIPMAFTSSTVDVNSGNFYGYSPVTHKQAYGIPSMWPEMCWDTNNYGYVKHPPIYGFENVSQCCITSSGTNICGWCNSAWCKDFMRIPGAGGSASFLYGGATSNCGDAGRFGMVRITYC